MQSDSWERGGSPAAGMLAVDDPGWRRYMAALTEAADQRARELGAAQWAREELGPVPVDPVERLGWERRAGQVAVYRGMAGHEDAATALGPAPKVGKVEQQADWPATVIGPLGNVPGVVEVLVARG